MYNVFTFVILPYLILIFIIMKLTVFLETLTYLKITN